MSQVLADSRNLVGVRPHSPSSQLALYHNNSEAGRGKMYRLGGVAQW